MTSLEEYWPEQVVAVQTLSESGIAAIPDRYVKPPLERPCLVGNTTHNLNIPVIDLAGLVEGPGKCRATMQAVSDACREWGFFQVVNHGVSVELMKKTREVWRSFFHLPMGKKQLHANSPKTYEGYGSRLGVEKGALLDWGDYYYLHLLPDSLRDHDKWPIQPSSCREITEEYGHELVRMCGVLMQVLSISLGLDVDVFQKAFGGEDIGACMRVNYYPKCPQPGLTLGLSAHSDPGGLTVLLADDCVTGLQVRKGDAWVTVHPVPNAFIINMGDQIQVLSNAVYKSVEHRVRVNEANERISLAFFYNPRSDLPVAPVEKLVSPERPPRYQPMTFNEYRMYIRTKGPRGKLQVECHKASAM